LFFPLVLSAQTKNKAKFQAFLGAGYYESLFLGGEIVTSKGNNWQLGAGYNFNVDNIIYHATFIGYGKPLFFKTKPKLEMGTHLQVMYWRQSDIYLTWGNIGVMPNIYTKFKLPRNFILNTHIGPQYNTNLHNARNSYEKTGWPKTIDINFSISIAYEF